MTSTIHPIRGREPQRRRHPARHKAAAPHGLPVIRTVSGEGIVCTVTSRKHAPVRRGASPSVTTATTAQVAFELLQEHRGFLAALCTLYGVDLSQGFEKVAIIEEIRATPAFVVDDDHRLSVIDELCRRTLRTEGFVVMRPGPDSWQLQQGTGQPTAPVWNHELMLCHLLGSSGFAQLCDDEVLDEPVPLFLRPWQAQRRLLSPLELPQEPFSRSLAVHRVGEGRMILFEKDCC